MCEQSITYLRLWSRLHQRQWVLPRTLWHPTIIQIGRDLRRAVAQPPASSRASYEVRLGYLVLNPFESWKLLMLETLKAFAQFSLYPVSSSQSFSLYSVTASLASAPTVFQPPGMCYWEESSSVILIWKLLLNGFEKFLQLYWKRNKILIWFQCKINSVCVDVWFFSPKLQINLCS